MKTFFIILAIIFYLINTILSLIDIKTNQIIIKNNKANNTLIIWIVLSIIFSLSFLFKLL